MRIIDHRWGVGALIVALTMGVGGRANASLEDQKREISLQQKAASDLERLDELHATTGELALLRTWLDEAWARVAKEEEDKTREVLDRTIAQAELIRQMIASSRLGAQAQARESALAASRDKLAKTKQALQDVLVRKKAMEMNSK